MNEQQRAALTAFDAAIAALSESASAVRDAFSERVAVTSDSTISYAVLSSVTSDAQPLWTVQTPVVPPISGQLRQFLARDAGTGPSWWAWDSTLCIEWRNRDGRGDWTDANGFSNGSVPWVESPLRLGVLRLDVTAMLKGGHRGIILRCPIGSFGRIAGRLSSAPPTLTITYADGTTQTIACLASAGWALRTVVSGPMDTRQEVQIGADRFALLRFDIDDPLPADATATMTVMVTIAGSNSRVQLMQADPPRFWLAEDPAPSIVSTAIPSPTPPTIYAKGDFANSKRVDPQRDPYRWHSPVWGHFSAAEGASLVTEPDGVVSLRTQFVPVSTGTDPRRGAFNGGIVLMRPDMTNPLRPPGNVVESAYAELELTLEDDFRFTDDGNKFGVALDLRLGRWVDVQPGYWQHITGNGGARGDGRAYVMTLADGSQRWACNGHMLRMECGQQAKDNHPYADLRPLIGYNYHIDQRSAYPGGPDDPLGGPCYGNVRRTLFRRGQRIRVAQYVVMNSIDMAAPDASGNGQALPDGRLLTWINGTLVDERVGYRWRRHPLMGIGAVGCNLYLGGVQPFPGPDPMHMRVHRLLVADRHDSSLWGS